MGGGREREGLTAEGKGWEREGVRRRREREGESEKEEGGDRGKGGMEGRERGTGVA